MKRSIGFYILSCIFLVFAPFYSFAFERHPKLLHLTFHKGCEREIAAISQVLSIDLQTWFIPDLPPKFFDSISAGNALYNIGHMRAENIWNLHRDYFNTFDAVIISDTAPLSRIFLQNEWEKPLIIWICNRFDYTDRASLDCEFPDAEYYHLFKEACFKSRIKIIGYTAFEHHYARSKGIDTGDSIIKPSGAADLPLVSQALIPVSVNKAKTFYLPPYWNESKFMDLTSFCEYLGLECYHGRYSTPLELKDFKAIIHLPYAWSNLALFENMALGIPYLVPSSSFLKKMANEGTYFHADLTYLIDQDLFHLSEWYCPEHAPFFVYFDSWGDLQEKIVTTDFISLREKMKRYSSLQKAIMIDRWKLVFEELFAE